MRTGHSRSRSTSGRWQRAAQRGGARHAKRSGRAVSAPGSEMGGVERLAARQVAGATAHE
eukprot:scaffold24447_cov48-Phaeocystis_antarctica.AAC.1